MTHTPIYDTTIRPGDVLSCGDIHGRSDLLDVFLDYVKGTQTTVILLGDLIDRGHDDLGVLERVEKLLEEPGAWGLEAAYALRGNHEQMYLDACKGYGIGIWANNGGKYLELDQLSLHSNWVRNLPIYMVVGDTMFLHAGVFPGVNPAETINAGSVESLVWVRSPFLEYGPQFEKWNPNLKRIVFGHTPKFDGPEEGKPYEIPNGICIDSGAYWTGTLTSYNATRNTFQQHTIAQ